MSLDKLFVESNMRLGFNAYARPAPVPKMPPGLVEIMEGLSREVLKHNPADTEVYNFCANHMKKLLEIRDAVEGKKVKQPLSLEEKIARCQEKVRQKAAQRRKREVSYLETEDKIDKAATSHAVEESIAETQTQGETIEQTCEDISEITNRVTPLLQETQVQGETIEQTCEDISEITNRVTPLLQETQAQGETIEQSCEDISEITNRVTPLLQETEAQGETIEQTCDDISEVNKLVTPLLQENNANPDKEVDRLNNIEVACKESKEPVVDELQILTDTKEEIAEVENVLDVKETSKEINILTEPLTPEDPDAKSKQTDAVLEAENTGIKQEEIITQGNNVVKIDTIIDEIVVADKNVAIHVKKDEERHDSEEISVQDAGSVMNIIGAQNNDSDKKETTNNENNSETNTESLSEDFTKIQDINIQEEIIEAKTILSSEHDTPPSEKVLTMKEDAITNAIEELKSDEPELISATNMAETRPEVIEIMTRETVKHLSAVDAMDNIEASESPEKVMNNIETGTEGIIKKEQDTSKKQESPLIEKTEFEAINEKPENKDFEETGDSITPVSNDEINKEIEMIQLSKTPEIIDEDSLKENEISIVAKSNDQGTLVSVNASDRIDEANSPNTSQVKKDLDTEIAMKIMNIDMTTIAKSDSTQDVTNEETRNGNAYDITRAPDETPTKSIQAPGMDLETAAVTIQKVFRSFLFKSRQSTLEDVSNDEGSIDVADDNLSHEAVNMLKTEDELHASNIRERRSMGISRMESVLQTVNEEKSLSLSTDDSSLSSAATIIQAHVRGFLVRNKLHNKTSSTNSQSLEVDNEPNKNKTVLNIIVPEGGHFMSRDESMAMSLDLPYDGSPPASSLYKLSLHPLSYDVSERRKLLKREDAIQSVSPPSTNSGKLSEDVDSVKDMTIHDNGYPTNQQNAGIKEANEIESQVSKDETQDKKENDPASGDTTPTKSVTGETVVEVLKHSEIPKTPKPLGRKSTLTKQSSDEMDVVTPFAESDEQTVSPVDSDNTSKLLHSSEFHDPVLPTNVSRTDTSVARGE